MGMWQCWTCVCVRVCGQRLTIALVKMNTLAVYVKPSLCQLALVAATNQARKLQLHLAWRTQQAARIKQEVALLALR
jgi:hypothetical protein